MAMAMAIRHGGRILMLRTGSCLVIRPTYSFIRLGNSKADCINFQTHGRGGKTFMQIKSELLVVGIIHSFNRLKALQHELFDVLAVLTL
jgi:hypothetical protein